MAKYILIMIQLISVIILGLLIFILVLPIYFLAVILTLNPNNNEPAPKRTRPELQPGPDQLN